MAFRRAGLKQLVQRDARGRRHLLGPGVRALQQVDGAQPRPRRPVRGLAADVPIVTSAIDEASKILVKLYPGVFSQMMDGLEGMLGLPGG